MLGKLGDPALRTYVVWVPMSRGLERDVANATKEVWDPRARHYWDGDGQLIANYRNVLGGYNEPVWDTYLLYAKDATWDADAPPKPAYWMHQLGTEKRPRVQGPFWNSRVFADRVKTLVNASRQ